MTKTTRKYLWPASLVMSLALVGVLAAFVALAAAGSPTVQAHDPCDGLASIDAVVECEAREAVNPHTHEPTPTMMPPGDVMHASYPQQFWLEGLDNGARLSWAKPKDIAAGASVIGYRIHRDAWNPNPNHPINRHGDRAFNIYPANVLAASHSDRGLAYNTVYTYQVQALVRHSMASSHYSAAVAEWWNMLDCRKMNDVVEGHVLDGPAIGPDNASSPYCAMYAGLSAAAKTVVKRTYDAMGYNMGELSYMRTIETAISGGLLDALIAPPSPPRNVMASETCADIRKQTFDIMVTWDPPADPGRVPADFPGCATCRNQTPIHIGGDDAGIEVQPGMAVITGYKVERMTVDPKTGPGPWMTLDANVSGTSYTDKGRNANTLYKYRITAMNNASRYSDPSEVMEITVETPPEAQVPTSPDADPIDATKDEPAHVLFTWDPPGTAAGTADWRTEEDVDVDVDDDGVADYGNLSESMVYIIQRLDMEGPPDDWQTLATQEHQYLPDVPAAEAIDNVQTQEYRDRPDTGSYKYRVSAQLSACDRSEWVVTAREVQFQAEPNPPDNLMATAASSSTINLSWTEPVFTGSSEITEYQIEVAVTGGWREVATTTAIAYTVTDLDPGTEYTYRVRAMNEDEVSEPSDSATATTEAAAPPPPVGAPVVTGVSSNAAGSATIMLTPATNATVQYVWAAPVDGSQGMYSDAVAGNATSVTMTGLTSGMSYWFIALGGSGEGDQTRWGNWSGWSALTDIQ